MRCQRQPLLRRLVLAADRLPPRAQLALLVATALILQALTVSVWASRMAAAADDPQALAALCSGLETPQDPSHPLLPLALDPDQCPFCLHQLQATGLALQGPGLRPPAFGPAFAFAMRSATLSPGPAPRLLPPPRAPPQVA